jgi:hypothetical protein
VTRQTFYGFGVDVSTGMWLDRDMNNTHTHISPTDPGFYADHDTATLEGLAARFAADGQFIAANSGADHPMAVECAALWSAVTFALIAREVN